MRTGRFFGVLLARRWVGVKQVDWWYGGWLISSDCREGFSCLKCLAVGSTHMMV